MNGAESLINALAAHGVDIHGISLRSGRLFWRWRTCAADNVVALNERPCESLVSAGDSISLGCGGAIFWIKTGGSHDFL